MTEPIWKLIKNPETGQENVVWRKWEDGRQESCLVTAPDYTKFKADLANGVALEDATGTAMTADQIKSFMETLP